MKRFILLLFLPLAAHAQDMQTGHTFTDGDTVHASDLNAAVNSATIVRTFLSNKGAATPLSSDYVLFDQASTSTLKKTTAANLVTAGGAVSSTTVQSAKTVLAGPTGGAAAAPTFRVLKPADTTEATVTIPSTTIDWSQGHTFYKQLSANTTFTLIGGAGGQVITVAIRQAAAGGPYTATFSGVFWKGAVAPTQTTTPSVIDLYTFILLDGVGILGSASQNYH